MSMVSNIKFQPAPTSSMPSPKLAKRSLTTATTLSSPSREIAACASWNSAHRCAIARPTSPSSKTVNRKSAGSPNPPSPARPMFPPASTFDSTPPASKPAAKVSPKCSYSITRSIAPSAIRPANVSSKNFLPSTAAATRATSTRKMRSLRRLASDPASRSTTNAASFAHAACASVTTSPKTPSLASLIAVPTTRSPASQASS